MCITHTLNDIFLDFMIYLYYIYYFHDIKFMTQTFSYVSY